MARSARASRGVGRLLGQRDLLRLHGRRGGDDHARVHVVSVAFGADSVFGEVSTDSVGATIVVAEGPNPCVLGTSSSREEYDGCLETNGISGRRLDERERATPARASRRLVVASDDDIDEVCGPSCNVDDGSVTDDASKLVVGMEIETDLEAEEISAGVGAATDSVVAAATADCSCSETDCNALACAFCDASATPRPKVAKRPLSFQTSPWRTRSCSVTTPT